MKAHRLQPAAAAVLASLLLTACFGPSPQERVARAKSDLQNGNKSAAVVELKSALEKDPTLAEARFLLARSFVESGDLPAAMIELDKARDAGYDPDAVVPLQAYAMLGLRQFDKLARDSGYAKLRTDNARADFLASKATAELALGRVADAKKDIETATGLVPGSIKVAMVRARVTSATDGYEAGLKAIDAILASNPKVSQVWSLKGEVLSQHGQTDDAIAAMNQAVALDSKNLVAHLALVGLYLGKKDLPHADAEYEVVHKIAPRSAVVKFLAASLALERNDLVKANEQMQQVLKLGVEDPKILRVAGIIALKRGVFNEAIGHLSQALGKMPGDRDVILPLAAAQLQSGDPDAAVATLKPLLRGPKPDVEALSLAAQAKATAGLNSDALNLFGEIAKASPGDVHSRVVLALADVQSGHADQGLNELRALAHTSKDPSVDNALVSALASRGEYDKALEAVNGLEAKQPKSASVPNLRGQIYAAKQDVAAARKAFEQAQKLDPDFFPAVANLATLDVSQGDAKSAVTLLDAYVAKHPKQLEAAMALASAHRLAGAGNADLQKELGRIITAFPDKAQPRSRLADLKLAANDPKGALATAQEAVARLPDVPEALATLAHAQTANGSLNEAIQSYNKLIALQPKEPAAYLLLAQLYVNQKDMASAKDTLERAASANPDAMVVQEAAVRLGLIAKDYAWASAQVDRLIKRHPDASEGNALAAQLDAAQQHWPDAIAHLKAALAHGDGGKTAVAMHRALLASGQISEAGKFADEWVAQHPKDALFLFYRGDEALAAKDYVHAEVFYRQILAAYPDSALAANNVAWLLNTAGKPGAEALAEKAVRLNPDQPAFMDTYAAVLSTGGKLDKALSVQKRAVELAPSNSENRLHLAQYYLRLGQKDAARAELNKLAALGDKSPQYAEVQQLLKQL